MNANAITIDDMNYLLRALKGMINSHLDCSNPEKAADNIAFMDFYTAIQDDLITAKLWQPAADPHTRRF